jgi:hypothetical protein
VLFFDDFGYEHFDQVAGALKRRGIAPIRVRVPPLPSRPAPLRFMRRLRDRLFYERSVALYGAEAEGLLGPDHPGLFDVRDVVLVETAVAAVGLRNPVLRQVSARALALSCQPAERVFDKFEANILMAKAGLSVPRQIAAAETSAAAAAATLGLPLVVKIRQGLGGDGVVIAHSAEAAERARRQLEAGHAGGLFYQAYIPGETVGYGCVQGADGPLLDYGFRVMSRQWELGPPAEVSLDGDPQLLEAGRRAVAALGCRGFAQIDFIRDSQGQVWPLDANLRPWSQTLSILGLGIDVAGAYAALVLGRPQASPQPCAAASQPIFPFALYDAVRRGSWRLAAARARGFLRMCRRGPGPAYALIVAAKAATLLVGRLARRLALPRFRAPAPQAGRARGGAS